MIIHYTDMGLINSNGRWTHPKVASIGQTLLPKDVTKYDLMGLVEEMASNANKNPYLNQMLESLQGDYKELDRKITTQGHLVFPDLATLALVFETMTREMAKDWKFHEACQNIWKKKKSLKKIVLQFLPQGEIFKIAKILSVREVIDRTFTILRRQSSPINFWRNELVLNILEAQQEDARNRNLKNAQVGSILAKYPCGDRSNGKFNARYVILYWVNIAKK